MREAAGLPRIRLLVENVALMPWLTATAFLHSVAQPP